MMFFISLMSRPGSSGNALLKGLIYMNDLSYLLLFTLFVGIGIVWDDVYDRQEQEVEEYH